MLYRGMDRTQLDAAYNNTALSPSATRLSPTGRHGAQRRGANMPVISTLPTATARESGSICSSPPIPRRRPSRSFMADGAPLSPRWARDQRNLRSGADPAQLS
jgi:hypothetical protein